MTCGSDDVALKGKYSDAAEGEEQRIDE